MMSKGFMRLIGFLAVFAVFLQDANAQWGAPYGNSWIDYGKPYVKIGVVKKGIHKVPLTLLPKDFPVDQLDKLQLWHRGKQVALLSTANGEIQFYGLTNDGASDSLLYRPMSSRMNPYWSMYSDQGAYFLTVGDVPGMRAEMVNRAVDSSIPLRSYHRFSNVNIYNAEYSLSTTTYIKPDFINSFFEIGASRTGKITAGGKVTNYAMTLTNLVKLADAKPTIKLMIHGRNAGARKIEISVGKDDKSLRLVTALNSGGFAGAEYSFNLNESDVDAANKGILNIKSVSSDPLDNYSLAYYQLTYPQTFDMQSKLSYEFGLPSASGTWDRLNIINTPAKPAMIDISQPDQPRIVIGQPDNLMISRKVGSALNLLLTTEYITVEAAKISSVDFKATYPTTANYIVITSENLLDGAQEYADYRSSADGGGFRPLVANINDIYNQFNYGEPSPVAIRKFVDYMLSAGIKDQYVYLIGKSITFNERMIRELPGEVPTIGFPGSDNLLVEGLGGARKDVPSIPIGRLSAVTNENIRDYLQKVKEYEHNTLGDLGWRKNVLHLNGGKTVSEITQLKGLLSSLAPAVVNGLVGGKVTPFVKQQGIGEVESVNITPEVNSGVGLITYFGHGSPTVTDLDMGYATDADRNYNNYLMYPMMYFNGCGVGNIFSARFNPNPTAGDRYALSMDWLLAPKRGAIAIIANSFESYVAPSSQYLDVLYDFMFTDASTAGLSIGLIQSAVARKIVTTDGSIFNLANVHQSLLQGDPVLKVISVAHSDYAVDAESSIKIYSESVDKTIEGSANLQVKVFVENLGRFVKEEIIPVQVTYYYPDGSNMVQQSLTGFASQDTLSLTIANNKNIQRIEVKVDPANTITELKKTNNYSELVVDWSVAKGLTSYPQGAVKDIVPPVLGVTFNNRNIKNDEIILPKPFIKLVLLDDRVLAADTSHIEVFIKPCVDNSCEFKRVNYGDELKIDSVIGNHSFQLLYQPTILSVDGKYELLVTAKDQAGNASVLPYRIRFEINKNETSQVTIVASPNPASEYVRFETTLPETKAAGSIEWIIYNLKGIVVDKRLITAATPGINEWYWKPTSVPSGLYVYKVIIRTADQNVTDQLSGKIVLTK